MTGVAWPETNLLGNVVVSAGMLDDKQRRRVVMRLPVQRALLMLLLSLICCCAFLNGGVAAETDGHAAAPTAAARPDARLAQKVTYEARFKSVGQIMADLSAITGIKLHAGYNRADWQVYGRKMNIFVKDVQFADLMNSIARSMKFRWGRTGEFDPPVYRVVVDSKALNEANRMKARAEKETEEIWRIRRERWVDTLMRDGAKSDSEVNEMRRTDPVFYRVAKVGAARAIRALFEEIPETKDRFLAGQSFRIAADKLSPETCDLLLAAADEFQKFMQRGRGQDPAGVQTPFELDNTDIACVRLDVDSFTPNLRWKIHSMGTVGYFHAAVAGKEEFEISDMKDRDADWVRAYCDRENDIMDGLGTFRSRYPDLERVMPQAEAYAERDRSLYPSEPLIEHSEFPELDKALKLRIDPPETEENPVLAVNSYIARYQKALADATGMGIVSDSWANIEGDKLSEQETTLRELLDKFTMEFNYNWDKPSAILEFRHRKWWKNRLDQIPDEWVTTWSESTRKSGVLSLDDLAQISALTYDQAEESLEADKVLGVSGIYRQILDILDANCNLHWLRLYSMLSARQRMSLTSEYGLNGLQLTDEQWRPAQYIFDRIGSSRGEAVFHLELLPNDKDVVYRFMELDSDSGEEDRKWVITLPRYVSPPND